MKRVRFTSLARREFLAQVAFYNAETQGLGNRFAAAVEEAAARAVAFPYSGSPAAGGTRRVFVKNFPISLVYRPGKIVIFAIAHHSRLPDFWSTRVRDVTR